jgi:hypothetical protein
MAVLPYVTAPGNIDRALRGIISAATPDSVSQDFVKTILKIPGGSGNQMTSFLKKIGFVNADGAASELYRSFRNPSTTGKAALEALRIGYAPLFKRNEYMHQASDEVLKGLIIQETGQSDDSSTVGLILACIKAVKKFAELNGKSEEKSEPKNMAIVKTLGDTTAEKGIPKGRVGLNLGYTINLNLPATSDISVFNAIFKSLKDNLLRDSDEQN